MGPALQTSVLCCLQVKDYLKKGELTSSSHSSICQLLLQGTRGGKDLGAFIFTVWAASQKSLQPVKIMEKGKLTAPSWNQTLTKECGITESTWCIGTIHWKLWCKCSVLKDPTMCQWLMLPGTPPTGCHCRDMDLYVQQCEERHSLQQWPGTPMTALSTGPAFHLPEHHTLNLFHQTRCSSGGVQCLLADSQDLFTQCHLDRSLLPEKYFIWWHCGC